MNKLFLFLIIFYGCGSFSKIENFRQVSKRQNLANDLFFLGEKYRREKNYSLSLEKYLLANEIYRSKFDYSNEAKTLGKIGYVFSKLKNRQGIQNTVKRLKDISGNFNKSDELIDSIKIRESIEFKEKIKAKALILETLNRSTGIKKYYYEALYIDAIGFDENHIKNLILWNKNNQILYSKMNDLDNPESLLFINKILAKIGKENNDKILFTESLENCEKIINFFELVEYSDSIRELKKSWIF